MTMLKAMEIKKTSKLPSKGFAIVPAGVQAYMSGNEFKVYAAIAAFVNKVSNQCYPSTGLLELITGIPKKNIGRITRSLRQAGWINVLHRFNQSSIYNVFYPADNLKEIAERSGKHRSEPPTQLRPDTPEKVSSSLNAIAKPAKSDNLPFL